MKRPISPNDEQNKRLQIVSWFDKKEWHMIYHQAYSDNAETQEKAYTQMCIWKARYPNLPLGVECTMNILHVKLCDKQTVSTLNYKDRDLQLLYSTAVMRFLNHLTVMSNCKDSMYKMAERHEIPDWLINLRHEAAHGNSVPALYLLRQASDIILQWLRDHYWEAEANIMADVYVNQEMGRVNEYKITNLLELWVLLKMNYWAGCKTIDRISNEDIRKRAMDLAEEEGIGIKCAREEENKKRSKKLKKKDTTFCDDEMVVNYEETDTYTHKIKTAFEPLLRKLFEPLKKKIHKKIMYRECFIESLIKYKAFCPQIDVDQLAEAEVLQLMSLLGELWKEVLESLQSHELLHCMLSALMSCDSELPSAQLWLRLLTHLLSGESPPHPPGTEPVCQLLAGSLPCEVEPEVLLRKANLHHVKHQRPLGLKPASVKERQVLQQLCQRILYNPTRFTSKYLHSLLGFWETPPLSDNTREKLSALAQIYNSQEVHRKRPIQVYTLASLLEHGLIISQSDDSVSDQNEDDSSPWKLYAGDADWSKCALGALPWQN